MTDKIQCGDEVIVHWTNGETSKGVVTWVPQGEGDMWYIKNDKTVMAVNPSCSSLECIVKSLPAKGKGE